MEAKRQAPYVELPVFQGPLDLLLHLIQQNKVDIYDIRWRLLPINSLQPSKKWKPWIWILLPSF
jgi:hypothetical protein